MFARRGRAVVLECTYAREESCSSLVQALAESSTPLWVVELVVTSDEAVRRFHRREQATDLTDESLRERVEEFPYTDEAFRVETAAE